MILRGFHVKPQGGGPSVFWQFQPKQGELLDALEATGESVPTVLGMAGSRGSAKSGALRGAAVYLAMTYPGIVIYIVRRVLGDLLENHMEKIKSDFPPIHAFYRQGDYEYQLPNKSRIVFIYAESAGDVERVSYGPECTFLFIDQAEQFSENELISFRICNRWPSAPKGFVKTCYFFNVGVGVGAGGLRRLFHLRSFKGNERPSDYKFFHVFGWDNFEWFKGQVDITIGAFYELPSETRFAMFISKTSEGRKMDALPKHRREAELLGNFDSFSGQYFSDVWGEHCILTADLVNRLVEPWWSRWMAQDWAFAEHAAHGWFVTGKVSPSKWVELFGGECEWPIDVVVLYRELVQQGRAEPDFAWDVVRMTPKDERITDFWLSQDAFGQKAHKGENTVGQAYTDIFRANGLPEPYTADQNRITGWRFMYNCLRQAGMRGANVDRARAQQGPAFFISVECPVTIENLPLVVRDEKNTEDVARVAGALWEDIGDMCRYGLKSKLGAREQAPKEVRAAEVAARASDPTDRHLRMLHFEEAERARGLVSRQPRWR
jgi:hypothetical protein